MKLNNKGFTLVELLAVVVILIAISAIAIPAISSSMDRTKDKQYKAKVKLVESAAKLYVSDHKNAVGYSDCNILVSTLVNEDYIDEDEDIPGNTCVWYSEYENKYEYMSRKERCNDDLRCGTIVEYIS